jgi:hypothetical protein
MAMTKLAIFALAILMASVVTAAATPAETCEVCKVRLRIPAQYRGEWCAITEAPTEIYKRCPGKSAQWKGAFMQIGAREIQAPEVGCSVFKITALRVGHRIQRICGEGWERPADLSRTNERWRLSTDGRYLIVRQNTD